MKDMFTEEQVIRWKEFYEKNIDLEVMTRSSAVELKELKDFISDAEAKYSSQQFNAFRIYFIRYEMPEEELPHIKKAGKKNGKDISQVSLAFVPQNIPDWETMKGEDLVLEETTADGKLVKKIFALAFCLPGEVKKNDAESIKKLRTGHCPPIGCPPRGRNT